MSKPFTYDGFHSRSIFLGMQHPTAATKGTSFLQFR
jgi:hypothetical protein